MKLCASSRATTRAAFEARRKESREVRATELANLLVEQNCSVLLLQEVVEAQLERFRTVLSTYHVFSAHDHDLRLGYAGLHGVVFRRSFNVFAA